MKKKAVMAIAAIVILVGAGIPAYLYLSSYNDGTLRFSAADMPIASGVSAVYITFSEIEMHGNGSGWSNYTLGKSTVNIFNVTVNASAFFASINLPTGRYTMMRVMIESVNIVILGSNFSFNLSSHWGFVNHPFNISSHSTMNVILDFNLSQCLNMESRVFTPYIGVFIS